MPGFGLDQESAEKLAAFIVLSPLEQAPVRELPPTVSHRGAVSYELVEKRVFKKICWHCHASPDYARGDGGPGNTGGFGYRARGLDLSSYEGVMSGSIGDDGKRRSIFTRNEAGQSLLMGVLLARQHEVVGKTVPGFVGMPLGFPPIPPKDIALVQAWIAAGRPR
jgi:hypothetical protein